MERARRPTLPTIVATMMVVAGRVKPSDCFIASGPRDLQQAGGARQMRAMAALLKGPGHPGLVRRALAGAGEVVASRGLAGAAAPAFKAAGGSMVP